MYDHARITLIFVLSKIGASEQSSGVVREIIEYEILTTLL